MECSFRVGQKVVCVDAAFWDEQLPQGTQLVGDLDGLQLGAVYTVREIMISPTWLIPLVLLEEIERPHSFIGGRYFESGFDPKRFRPVVERGIEKGMSILRELLNKQNQPVREDA
ncbi:hypothetical protein GR138_12865 [Shinella kummerowiae]|uniref:Uncharacterized protein n=1 Tax=Shinella kummerowiae TaxID=417745 RepID=A0A6N8SGR5_9HYPH|nr:hypothetical protein [Shinella kummerowiae]MXN46082.1 hypothetical protein [Shinella kummerowiae]